MESREDNINLGSYVQVRFFNSPGLLSDFTSHTRTLRLYPRPVVAFQTGAFLRSRRPKPSQFTAQFATTQVLQLF